MSLQLSPSHLVGIGVSAGGIAALEEFLEAMPIDSGMALVLVQQASSNFNKQMNVLLARHTQMTIRRAINELPLDANTIYMIPPQKVMKVIKGCLYLEECAGQQCIRPIDTFFESLADAMPHQAIGIIFSGVGSDGSHGIQKIHEAGGLVLVQNPESAEFAGMPRAAINTGHYDFAATPGEMPALILEYTKNPEGIRTRGAQRHGNEKVEEHSIHFAHLQRANALETEPAQFAERLELATRVARIGIWDWNIKQNEIVWDDQMYALYGLVPGEFGEAQEAWRHSVHPEDRKLSKEITAALAHGTRELHIEFRVFWSDGSVHWLKTDGEIFRDQAGNPIRVVGANYDITEQKLAEKAMINSQVLLHDTERVGNVGGWELNLDTLELVWTEQVYQMYEVAPDFIPTVKKAIEFYAPEERKVIEKLVQGAIESGKPYDAELPFITAKGKHRWVHTNGAVDLAQRRVYGFFQDITERKQVEFQREAALEKLRETEVRFQQIADNIGEVFWMFDNCEKKLVYINAAYEKIYGRSREETYRNPQQYIDAIHPDDRHLMLTALESQARGERTEMQYRIVHADGSFRWILDRSFPIFNEKGTLVRTTGIATDITESKQAVEKLRDSEEKWRSLFEILPVGVSIVDADNVILDTNPGLAEILALSSEELSRGEYHHRKYFHPDRTPLSFEEFPSIRAIKEQKTIRNVEIGIEKENGTVIWTSVSATPLFSGAGAATVTSDITDRKQAEEKLQVALTKYQTLFDSFPLGITVADQHGTILETNPVAEKLLGLSKEELDQRVIDSIEWPIIRPNGTPMPAEEFASVRALNEGRKVENVEMGIFKSGGETTWINVTAAPLRVEGYGVVIAYSDITERKRVEAELKESEELFRAFFENATEAILITKPNGSILKTNPAACRMFKLTEQEFIAGRREAVVDLTDPRLKVLLKTRRKTGKMHGEITLVRGDNTKFEGEVTSAIYLDKQGEEKTGMIIRDVTDRKAIEYQLRENERQYRELVQNANSAILRWKHDGTVTFFNEFAQAFFGYRPEEIVGQPVSLLLPPTDSTGGDLSLLVQNILEHPDQFVNVVNENVRRDGRRAWIAWTNTPVYAENGEVTEILAVGSDVTELKRMEDDLRRSNADLEQFAYVASHDLQEPLRTVTGMVQLLQQRYQDQLDENANEYIHYTVDAAVRMQNLISDLLEFSRIDRKSRPFVTTEMEKVLQTAKANLQTAIADSRAQITSDPLPIIQADRSQLTQVLQNLLSNAIKFRSEEPLKIHISAEKIEDGWQFGVHDNGIGIDPQYFERIFLLFQRLHTRRQYPGTGIGLALSKKIIDRHGGRMWIQSALHQGATFFFTIPER